MTDHTQSAPSPSSPVGDGATGPAATSTPAAGSAIPDLPGAKCKGTDGDLFYPRSGRSNLGCPDVMAALQLCDACPSKTACLQWALEHREHGIWGGMTERQRAHLLRGAVA